MTLTVAQAIEAMSSYTVGHGGDIDTDTLTVLQNLVAGEVTRLNPGFVGNDLVRLEAYLVLNAYEAEDIGLQNEKIKDHSWTYLPGSTGSHWLDACKLFIASYKSVELADFGVIERCDSEMRSVASDQIRPETFGTIDTDYERQVWDQDYA